MLGLMMLSTSANKILAQSEASLMAVSVLLFLTTPCIRRFPMYTVDLLYEMIAGPESQDSLTQRMKDLFRVERKACSTA